MQVRKLILFVLCMAAISVGISGCSIFDARQKRMEDARSRYEDQHGTSAEEKRKLARRTADADHKSALECGGRQALLIDDGVSDAATISLAVSRLCASEYESYVSSYIEASEENKNVKHMLQKRAMSEQYRIQYFLVPVLKARRTRE